ncbi:hypothetical protein ACWD5Q_06490 [Streptomyces sp. NPDC002513]
MTAPESTAAVAVELAELRGEIRTGLTEIKGSLAVLVERTARTDEDVKQLRTDVEKDVASLRVEVEALKTRRWPLGAIGAISGMAGAAAGVAALFQR